MRCVCVFVVWHIWACRALECRRINLHLITYPIVDEWTMNGIYIMGWSKCQQVYFMGWYFVWVPFFFFVFAFCFLFSAVCCCLNACIWRVYICRSLCIVYVNVCGHRWHNPYTWNVIKNVKSNQTWWQWNSGIGSLADGPVFTVTSHIVRPWQATLTDPQVTISIIMVIIVIIIGIIGGQCVRHDNE